MSDMVERVAVPLVRHLVAEGRSFDEAKRVSGGLLRNHLQRHEGRRAEARCPYCKAEPREALKWA